MKKISLRAKFLAHCRVVRMGYASLAEYASEMYYAEIESYGNYAPGKFSSFGTWVARETEQPEW